MNAMLTSRSKWLLALVALLVAYIALTSDDATNNSATVSNPRSDHTKAALTRETARARNTQFLPKRPVALASRVATDADAEPLFAVRSWYVPPPPPRPESPPPVAAPTAPPLPYTALGSYVKQGSERVFFLQHGDSLYDVKIGDVLEGTYSVDGFADGQLLLTYKPLHIQQTLLVGGGS